MRGIARILADFETGETTATYTQQALKEDGSLGQQIQNLTEFRRGKKAMMSVAIPATGLGGTVAGFRFACRLVKDGTQYWAADVDGELIEVPVTADTKGRLVPVKFDFVVAALVQIVAVNGSGDTVAPGDVTIELEMLD